MNVLDLFSGIGGFSLGLERAGMRTVAFCEIEPYCRKVLAKHWPDIPIHEDIRELNGEQYRGTVDLICGGFPCQPFSSAGKRAGASDDRALWPEMYRVIREVQPAWVIAENVAGFVHMELDNCLSDLEAIGYAWQPFIIPACAVDAKHRRDRVWIITNATGGRGYRAPVGQCQTLRGPNGEQAHQLTVNGEIQFVADTQSERCGEAGQHRCQQSEEWVARGGEENVADAEGAGQRPRFSGRGVVLDGATSRRDTAQRSQANVANTDRTGREEQRRGEPARAEQSAVECRGDVSDSGRWGSKGPRGGIGCETEPTRWEPEPSVGRVATGVPHRVDRLRGLGNAVVPQIPEIIGRAIMELAE